MERLRKWLAEPRSELANAVADCVCMHVAALKSRGFTPYGYALLPGEPYDIHSVVAVYNGEADIEVARNDGQYRYYRYCVDEWAHWDHDGFAAANGLLAKSNEQFATLHVKDDANCVMDEFEIAHSKLLFEAVVRGLEIAKSRNAFGGAEPFLVVWISDSSHTIMVESAQRLNSQSVAKQFKAEFG